MAYPRLDDFLRRIVVPQGLDQDLPSTRKLATENSMWAMCLVERTSAVLDRCSEVLCGVLVLEALDSIPVGSREHEANHRVGKATVDEVIDDGAKRGLSTELLEEAHQTEESEPMCGADQVASSDSMSSPSRRIVSSRSSLTEKAPAMGSPRVCTRSGTVKRSKADGSSPRPTSSHDSGVDT